MAIKHFESLYCHVNENIQFFTFQFLQKCNFIAGKLRWANFSLKHERFFSSPIVFARV